MRKDRVGVEVRCAVCDKTKKPVGRDAGLGLSYCDADCEGYWTDPKPGSLWPGEKASEFGFAIGPHGVREVDAEPADD